MLHYAQLSSRRLVRVAGKDAASFLQGLVTANVEALSENGLVFGALLTPQGKILFDFFIAHHDGGYLIDISADQLDEFIKRLIFYRLRAQVDIAAMDDYAAFGIWPEQSAASEQSDSLLAKLSLISTAAVDPRLAALGWRAYGSEAEIAQTLHSKPGSEAGYHNHRIMLGMPEGGTDFTFGEIFPHEGLMDQFGGIDFKKGCYVGQEVVSRMQHRGTARNRIIQFETIALPSPKSGDKLFYDEKPVGTVLNVVGDSDLPQGLALVRLDRVGSQDRIIDWRSADDEQEGDFSRCVRLKLQSWVGFTWP